MMRGKKTNFRTIDEYIANSAANVRKTLKELRAAIRAAAPEAEEKISYQVPTFALQGNLVHFAAFKDHISFFSASSGVAAFKKELSAYDLSKGTVRFPLDKPLPLKLIGQIVKFRVNENLKTERNKARPIIHANLGKESHFSYVAFLRGINVGGKGLVRMADLTDAFEDMGFTGVRTVLASGNVVFASERTDKKAITVEIGAALKKMLNRDIGVLLRGMDELKKLESMQPFKGIKMTPGIRLYVTFLAGKTRVRSIEIPYASERNGFRILSATRSEVFSVVDLAKGKGTPELMSMIEREFGPMATTRNWDTVLKTTA
jgi:uncharacterized protein (DUF1697 family)/uncharacterized protein YdhG (YjbR/CyaY superfamily)